MKLKRFIPLMAVLALVVGLLAGCGSGSSSGKSLKVIKIATQTPLSGGSATLGNAIKLGAQLSVQDYKAKFAKLGYKVVLAPYDDMADPKKGVSNAQDIASDNSILGIVGHLNSGVAIPSSSVYEQNHIAMVSPANTAVELTERGLKSVNRICARDDFQGPAGANYAVKTLKAKKIFIIQDKTAYGSGLASAFRDEAKKLGAKIVGYEGITVGEKDFSGVISQAAATKPDLLYFGGVYAEGGLIIKQARQQGMNMPIMGGDGLDSSSTVSIAGPAVKNVYFSTVVGDVTKTEAGRKFAADYKKQFGKDIEGYSAYGYDCGGVLQQAILNAIKKNGGKLPTRANVETAVRDIHNYDGLATKVDFDNKGDNKYAKIYIYKFDKASYPATEMTEIQKTK
ncbi:branched-chain amino acid ABC transporter substrate-binding protein [Sporolactobacillus spathodeae]|uniref:Branched-chain amino acid transport system substrate-binding protein n=1 Tax=Sporolactobacillus spathodeae TaxID=1465502 RepID=A0ABS2Q8S9_9BACL|nr:branched-chain amino acid ABC transporter substrate-binding protein [Sporolactobacillus spathodeae]MBM7658192.1 branched-chain amino acid transport system substrate-binding protein [Sporolactobacillus spathodeae]